MRGNGCSRCLSSLFMFLQVGVAAAVIALTATKLSNTYVTDSSNNVRIVNECYLGKTDSGASLCYYAYGVAGVSMLATLALGIVTCLTCNLCGLGPILDVVFAGLGTAWWAAAGILYNTYMQRPAVMALPQKDYRMAVWALCWGACALFGAIFLLTLYQVLALLCCCCGGRGGGGRSRDIESGSAPKAVVVPQALYGYPKQQQFMTGAPAGNNPYWNTQQGRY